MMTSNPLLTLIFTLIAPLLLVSVALPFSYATPTTTATSPSSATSEERPKPGTIIIITFENGTTKAIHSDSTYIRAVQGGYFISDPTVQASQPLQSETVSSTTVLQQLASMFIEIRVDEPAAISSEGCGEGYGYFIDDPNPICELLDKIGQGSPPPDEAFCAALGCPYNPPADSELPVADDESGNGTPDEGFATTPVTPTDEPAIGPHPQPGPDTVDEDQNDGGEEQEEDNQSEDSNSDGDSNGDNNSEETSGSEGDGGEGGESD